MSERPQVTVITPAYNASRYLPEAVRSVAQQTLGDYEHIIAVDLSEDDTAAVARALSAEHPRVSVVELPERGGSSAARNAAIVRARGEFTAFLDADDRWSPDFLDASVTALRRAPEHVVGTFAGFSLVDEEGTAWRHPPVPEDRLYDAQAVLVLHCPQGTGSSVLVRTARLQEVGGFDAALSNCVDFDTWMRLCLQPPAGEFLGIGRRLVDYRRHAAQMSTDSSKRVRGLAEIFRRYGDVVEPANVAQAYLWPSALAFMSGQDAQAAAWLERVRAGEPRYMLRSPLGALTFVLGSAGPLRPLARRFVRVGQLVANKARLSALEDVVVSASARTRRELAAR